MPTTSNAPTLTLVVDGGHDIAPDDLDALTRQLRQEMEDLGVESVTQAPAGAAPDGTKSVEAVALGTLVVRLFPAVLPSLIGFLQAWSLRGQNRAIVIKVTSANRAVELQYPVGTDRAEFDHVLTQVTAALGAATG
jgi:hypothetical protein